MNLRQWIITAGVCVVGFCWVVQAADVRSRPDSKLATEGRRLFSLNCAHCHGDDARGDEGPSLYNLRKSDERISAIVHDGIKGEMPAFRNKLKAEDVQRLIAFLRTLKE